MGQAGRLCSHRDFGDFTPYGDRRLARSTAFRCCLMVWAGQVKKIGRLIVNGQEPLRLPRRFKTLHDPLPSTRWLMGIFRPVVQTFVLAMLDLQRHVLARRAIRKQLVRDHDARRFGRLSQKFAHEASSGFE